MTVAISYAHPTVANDESARLIILSRIVGACRTMAKALEDAMQLLSDLGMTDEEIRKSVYDDR